MRRSLWIKAVAVIAFIWLAAGGAIWWARNAKPTPESLKQYIDTHSLDGKSARDREKTMQRVADDLNSLSYEDRRAARTSHTLDHFFRGLNRDEQGRFLDLTLPQGFKQMMEAFNNMDPAKRKEFVEKTMNDMKQHEGEEPPKEDDPNLQKMIDQGMRSFYSEANADVKMDFAPLIEQMQKNLQHFR